MMATWTREAELARSIPGVSFSELRNVVAKAEALEAGEVAPAREYPPTGLLTGGKP
jgi:hypothetical protein